VKTRFHSLQLQIQLVPLHHGDLFRLVQSLSLTFAEVLLMTAAITLFAAAGYRGGYGLWGFLGRNWMGVYVGHWYLVSWPWTSNIPGLYRLLDAATESAGFAVGLLLRAAVFASLPLVVALAAGPAVQWALLYQFGLLLRGARRLGLMSEKEEEEEEEEDGEGSDDDYGDGDHARLCPRDVSAKGVMRAKGKGAFDKEESRSLTGSPPNTKSKSRKTKSLAYGSAYGSSGDTTR
jgi:hypothetical protein